MSDQTAESKDVKHVDEIRDLSPDEWVGQQKHAMTHDPIRALANMESVGRELGAAIMAMGDRDEIREIAERIMFMHPEGRKVGRAACYAAAQVARMIGASFLPGTNEIHFWAEKNGNVRISIGRDFLRRRALELGGVLWEFEPRLMTDKERQQYDIPSGLVAAICRGVRAVDIERYRDLGFEPREIFQMCGRTGIATVPQGDYAKNGRPLSWTALKNAEIDLYRALFPTMYQGISQLDWRRVNQGYDVVVPPEISQQFDDLDQVEKEMQDGVTVDESGDELTEPALPFPDHLAFLENVPHSQDLDAMSQEDFWAAFCVEHHFRHVIHAKNALAKTLPDWRDRTLTRSQLWALGAYHKDPPGIAQMDLNDLLFGADPDPEPDPDPQVDESE